MKIFRFRVVVPAVAASLSLLFSGCTRESTGETSRLSVPKLGQMRVLFNEVTETKPGAKHYNWSVIGDRNWKTATADASTVALLETYPLNDTLGRGGCHTWNLDLKTEPASDGKTAWVLLVYGSNGVRKIAKGVDSGELRLLTSADQTPRSPGKLPLFTLGARTTTLTVGE